MVFAFEVFDFGGKAKAGVEALPSEQQEELVRHASKVVAGSRDIYTNRWPVERWAGVRPDVRVRNVIEGWTLQCLRYAKGVQYRNPSPAEVRARSNHAEQWSKRLAEAYEGSRHDIFMVPVLGLVGIRACLVPLMREHPNLSAAVYSYKTELLDPTYSRWKAQQQK